MKQYSYSRPLSTGLGSLTKLKATLLPSLLFGFALIPSLASAAVTNPYSAFAASAYSSQVGTCQINGDDVACASGNDYIAFNALAFGASGHGATSIRLHLAVAPAAAGQEIDIRVGSPTGFLAGQLYLTSTGSASNYQYESFQIAQIYGTQKIYLVFPGRVDVGPIDTIQFIAGVSSTPTPTPTAPPVAAPTATPKPSPSPTPASTPTPPPVVSAFYVSPSGNDASAGTLAAPFATLAKAKNAMRASTIKNVYLRAGAYSPPLDSECVLSSCRLALNNSDSGEHWSYYPADGVNSAVIDGQVSNGTGVEIEVIEITQGSNIIIDGLAIKNFVYAGVVAGNGASSITVQNCNIYNAYHDASSSNAAPISFQGVKNAVIQNNYIHDSANFGISAATYGGDISNLLIQGNYVQNTCTVEQDCGGIYVIDPSSTNTNMRVFNNYVRDGNTSGAGSLLGSSIYADDCTSNLSIKGNVVAGMSGLNTLMIHGGNNVVYQNNLIDLSNQKANIMNIQSSDWAGGGCTAHVMSGNAFRNNIVIANGSSVLGGYGNNGSTSDVQNPPAISNNDYYNFGGANIRTSDDYSDSSPVVANPLLSSWAYTLSSSSPARNTPVSFPGLPTQWGPPGFVVPQTGTAPSSPQSP